MHSEPTDLCKEKNILANRKRVITESYWESASNLTTQHYIATTPVAENSSVKLQSKEHSINLDEKMAYFMGRFLADGWISHYKRAGRKNSFKYYTYLCCGDTESNEIIHILKDLPFAYSMQKVRTGYKFCICGQKLCEYMLLMKRGAKNKIIHPDIWISPPKIQKSYIEGYFSGDGSLKQDGKIIKFTSISRKLLLGVKLLLIKNEKAKVMLHKTTKPSTYVIEGRTVNQSDLYDLLYKIKSNPKRDLGFIDENGYQWGPISSYEKIESSTQVYHIEIEEDNTYLANSIIVHC